MMVDGKCVVLVNGLVNRLQWRGPAWAASVVCAFLHWRTSNGRSPTVSSLRGVFYVYCK